MTEPSSLRMLPTLSVSSAVGAMMSPASSPRLVEDPLVVVDGVGGIDRCEVELTCVSGNPPP